MVGKKCDVCGKTAYPIEAVKDGDKTWHKLCFRCSVCKGTLNLKNFKTREGQLYCKAHYPSDKATTVADDVSTRHAVSAPKKVAEGLATVHKGDQAHRREGTDFTGNVDGGGGVYEAEEAGEAYAEEAYEEAAYEEEAYEEEAYEEEAYEEEAYEEEAYEEEEEEGYYEEEEGYYEEEEGYYEEEGY